MGIADNGDHAHRPHSMCIFEGKEVSSCSLIVSLCIIHTQWDGRCGSSSVRWSSRKFFCRMHSYRSVSMLGRAKLSLPSSVFHFRCIMHLFPCTRTQSQLNLFSAKSFSSPTPSPPHNPYTLLNSATDLKPDKENTLNAVPHPFFPYNKLHTSITFPSSHKHFQLTV